MDQTTSLTYAKYSIVGVFEVGVFVLAALGKIDPTTAASSATAGVAALVIALGLSAGGSALGTAMAKQQIASDREDLAAAESEKTPAETPVTKKEGTP